MKKKSIIITLVIIVIAIAISLFFYFQNPNRLTASEQRWLTDNSANIQNINIVNNINIFGNVGEGVYYSFLQEFTEQYEIEFNPITISNNEDVTNLSLMVGNTMPDEAALFYQDHYVLVAKTNESITNIHYLKGKKIGVLTRDASYIQSYFSSLETNSFSQYETIDDLVTNLNNNTVEAIIIPRM